jgi:hypothetical protein
MLKPKGKTPTLISGASGKPKMVVADGKSHCARCEGVIAAREQCFEIPKIGGAFTNKKRHCKTCFVAILAKTREDLDELGKLAN